MNRSKTGLLAMMLGPALLASSEPIAAQPATVPLAIVQGYPILPADIDGHKVRLIFDLGGDSLALTRTTLDELGIAPTGPAQRETDVKGNTMDSRTFEVQRLRIGDAVFRGITGRMDIHDPARFGAQGYIGPSIFATYRMVLDYRGGKMTLIPAGTARIERAGCVGTAVPFMDGVAKAKTDFGDLTFVWDTGFPFSAIRKARVDRTRAKVVNRALRTQRFRLNNVDFGPLELRPFDFSEPPGVDGFIGANFFEQHVVCLDFPANLILVQQ
jgi:hypothetical protein